MSKRIDMLLDDDAADLLPKLAGSAQEQGEFLSQLIRVAAQARQQTPASDGEHALAELGRQVLLLVESGDLPLSRVTALASEPALARLWDTPEEDEAWQHL